MSYAPGDSVLLRATVSEAGFVSVAPGVELPVAAVEVVTDVPRFDGNDPPLALILFFSCEDERQEFARFFCEWPNGEMRDLRA